MDKFKTLNLLDLSHTLAIKLFEKEEFPWTAINKIGDFIIEIGKSLSKSKFSEISQNIWVAKDTQIPKQSCILSPTIIDSNAQIRYGAFIRGNVIVGKNSIVGNSTELKNCILFDNSQTPHFNYVGDSILGFKAHIGAGVIISNLKSDKSNVKIKFNDQTIDTNMKKLGAILGDFSEVGCNSVLNPGTIIGRASTVYPLTMVRGTVESRYILKNNLELVKKL
ncbi:MAG: UDP-N-acetylglucosamine pyrophosphorylase [Oscillospiraceae bacterium]|jgi:NDP-sugar pyrophosphorylase family protein|nr:UDP-N-acetylglucosamine pyrophosphorylase [Oscillospiraceae bacterium]